MLRELADKTPDLAYVVLLEGAGGGTERELSLDDLAERGRVLLAENPDAVDAVVAGIAPDHLATLIYTSGTTGRPKGVELTQDNWTYEGAAVDRLGILRPDDLQYLWLPLSHSFGKVLLAAQLQIGFASAVDGRIDKIVENLATVRPTFMAGAPRVFEKVHNRVVASVEAEGGIKAKLFARAFRTGRKWSAAEQQGRTPGLALTVAHAGADKVVLSKLRERFGGRIRLFVSGSAPLSREVAEWFHAAGMLIVEGYGMTESSAATAVNLPGRFRFGTVGPALPGTELRIADDGELLVRGPGVMRGYHGLPEATAETLDDDGWLHTGDIGEVDTDGFLRITDRKKDMIKTSGGKFVAPQPIEVAFPVICGLASQFVVHGDGRNYVTALVTLDPDALAQWARDERGGRARPGRAGPPGRRPRRRRGRGEAAQRRAQPVGDDQGLPDPRPRPDGRVGRAHPEPQAQAAGRRAALQGRPGRDVRDQRPLPGVRALTRAFRRTVATRARFVISGRISAHPRRPRCPHAARGPLACPPCSK